MNILPEGGNWVITTISLDKADWDRLILVAANGGDADLALKLIGIDVDLPLGSVFSWPQYPAQGLDGKLGIMIISPLTNAGPVVEAK